MIRKLPSGRYRLYSLRKAPGTGNRRNLGTFPTREAALRHERPIQYFRRPPPIERIAVGVGRETLRESPAGVADLEPFVPSGALGESGVALNLVLHAHDSGQEGLRCETVKRLHRRPAAEGIETAHPARTLRWTAGAESLPQES